METLLQGVEALPALWLMDEQLQNEVDEVKSDVNNKAILKGFNTLYSGIAVYISLY